MTDTPEEINGTEDEPAEMREIIDLIRSVPRLKPTRSFRVRLSVYCYMPSLARRVIEGRLADSEKRSAGERGGAVGLRHAVRPARIAAAAALVILLAFGAFGVLTLAARNSQPDNPLYSVKRFRENLELVLTWGSDNKVQKNLSLAQTRLSELDYLIAEKKLDPVSLTTVAGDYTARRLAVEEILRQDSNLADAQEIASRLRVMDTTEENLEKRLLSAGGNAALAPASGARVTVRDSGGRPSLDGGKSSLETKAGATGQVSFSADISGQDSARKLEALVELDGRSEVLPVFPASFKSTSGKFTTSVSPETRAIELGRPRMYTLTITASDGADLGGKEVRLVDTTGTSSINGVGGEVSLTTDSDGSCAFTLTKDSLDHVSRVTATLIDGGAYDLGEVLTLGGLKAAAGSEDQEGVSVKSFGPPAGPQNIELNNGVIRVTAGTGRRGAVIDSITGVAEPGRAGPLYDPLAVDESGNESPGVEVSGPRLAFSEEGAAGYSVELVSPDGTRKTYQVVLAKGNAYVTVKCRIEYGGHQNPASSGREPTMEVARLEIAQGAEIEVSDSPVRPNTSDDTLELVFQVGRPFAVVESPGCSSILTFPINSETYPSGWSLGRTYIAPSLQVPLGASEENAEMTFVLGTGDRKLVNSLKKQSLRGIESGGEETGRETPDGADGFVVETSPIIDDLRKGSQELTLTIYKRYQTVLGR